MLTNCLGEIFYNFLCEHERNENIVDIVSGLAGSNTTLHTFFQPKLVLLKTKIKKLLKDVVYANYDRVEKLIKQHPAWMFAHVSEDEDKKFISPLKYAIKVSDAYMLDLFRENIEMNPSFLLLFQQQSSQQKERINLEPFFAEYQHYQNQRELWLKNKISDDELEVAWLQVGIKQRDLLPGHMWKCFFQATSWNPQNSFKLDKSTRPVGLHRKFENVSMFSDHNQAHLGIKFAYASSQYGAIACRRTTHNEIDRQTFNALYVERLKQSEEIILKLVKLANDQASAPTMQHHI